MEVVGDLTGHIWAEFNLTLIDNTKEYRCQTYMEVFVNFSILYINKAAAKLALILHKYPRTQANE